MEKTYMLYKGNWPRESARTGKYAVQIDRSGWKVVIYTNTSGGEHFLPATQNPMNLVTLVNDVKQTFGGIGGGVFYINEYNHLIVPILNNNRSFYYCAGKVDNIDLTFNFEKHTISSKPVNHDGLNLTMGDEWKGPVAGIPYVLESGGMDIHYLRPKICETDSQKVEFDVIEKIKLSESTKNPKIMEETLKQLVRVKGIEGGHFFVNEHKSLFVPKLGSNNNLRYIYCGQLNMDGWFPEPIIENKNYIVHNLQ